MKTFFPRQPSSAFFLFILITFNIIIRSLWLTYMHPPQYFDFDWYYTHAVQMAHGLGYTEGNQFTAYWPIGYPYFLSLLFRIFSASTLIGLVANACFSVGIVVLVYLSTLKMTSKSGIAFFAGLGYSILPSQIEWNSVLGSEELFTFLLLLSLFTYLFTDKKHWIRWTAISGIFLGLACDVRPLPLLFPAFLWGYELFIHREGFIKSTTRLLVFILAMGAGICPVTIRNLLVLHHFVLVSTNGGINLWQGTKADGSYFWSWNPYINPLLAAGNNDVLANQIGTHVFIQHVLHHPFWTALHGLFKLFFFYWMDSNVVSVTFAVGTKTMRLIVRMMMWFDTIIYWLWMLICLLGITRGVRLLLKSWRKVALPVFYIVYNSAIFFFFPAWDRFRYPIMPLYSVLFGIGLSWVIFRSHRKANKVYQREDFVNEQI